jgi:hypothetical protein
MMDTQRVDPTHVSELLFGRRCRLGVAIWALQHPKGRFFQSEPPAAALGASASNVRDELRRLVDLGMLEVERPEESTRTYYVRTSSPLWEVIAAAAEVIHVDDASGSYR